MLDREALQRMYWIEGKVNIGLLEEKVLELEISETGEVLRAR